MRGSRAGGVYQPRNLGLYAYAWNSPAVVRDPDGQAVVRNDSLAKAEKTILAEAQKETDDKISFDKFGILQIDKEATGKLKHPEGTKLLRRLINSPQIVTLTRRTDKGFHHITPADEDKVRHGDPTDSTIQLNVDDDQGLSILVGNGEQKGNRLERKSPFVVSLYHELIHADHYARGVRLVGTQTFSFWNAGGHLEFEDADQGELQAVGLGGLNKAGDVTENQIRQEQGLPLRQAIKGF
jgi:hypothetical protein